MSTNETTRRRRKGTHGGARPGAGRKKQLADAVEITITVERTQLDHLERFGARTQQPNRSASARAVLSSHQRLEALVIEHLANAECTCGGEHRRDGVRSCSVCRFAAALLPPQPPA